MLLSAVDLVAALADTTHTLTMRRSVSKVLPQLLRSHAAASSPAIQQIGFKLHLVRGFADDANLKKTALYDFHVAHGGKQPAQVTYPDRCQQCPDA
jgi:hypothetical protein